MVGRVGRPHGLDGSFFVEDPSEEPDRFATGSTLWVRGEEARVAASKRGAGGRPVIRLDRPVTRGEELTVPRDRLPVLDAGAYYIFQLVGLEVVEDGGASIGRVRDVIPGIANDVLELDTGLSLPMHEECVREVDLASGTIVVAPGYSGPG